MKKFIFFYFNTRLEKVREVVPSHIDFWNNQQFESYTGGPFSDKTGGMIIFTANSLTEANEIIKKDPFMAGNLISEYYIKEWLA